MDDVYEAGLGLHVTSATHTTTLLYQELWEHSQLQEVTLTNGIFLSDTVTHYKKDALRGWNKAINLGPAPALGVNIGVDRNTRTYYNNILSISYMNSIRYHCCFIKYYCEETSINDGIYI